MLLSSTAEAMYWCGRYTERAQALSRVLAAYERLGMDLQARPLDLKPLVALAGGGAAVDAAAPRTRLLQALAFDERNPSSVLGALGAARENLRSARVVAPPELWHILNRLYAGVGAARGRSEAALLDALDETLAAGQRFDGERTSGMLRDAAYAFLSMGSALERADMGLRSLVALLPVLRPDGWERAFDDVRFTGLLDALGVTSLYRRRHHSTPDLARLVPLLLGAQDCPRSVAFCLREIERQLSALPRAGRARAALAAAEQQIAALGGTVGERGVPELGPALAALGELHRALRDGYFPGQDAAALAEPRPSPASAEAPSDPFAVLLREHEQVEAALQVLDELAARAARGDGVDRGDLSALVGFFSELGELRHHEKEESILMPELVKHGFDWYDGPLARMRREHRQEHYFLRVLGDLARQLEAWSSETTRSFVSVTREFCRFLRSHMDHEQRDLFEQASRVLAPAVKSRLLADFAAFDARQRPEPEASAPQLLRKYRAPAPGAGSASAGGG